MKPRTLTTTKILAVAFAAAGCSSAVHGEASPPAPIQAESPPPAATSVEASAVPAPSPPAAIARAAVSDDPKLLALRDELARQGRAQALANPARFRPMCDKDGYPLVGNVVRKAPTQDYGPSAFCADVRAEAQARR